MKHFEVQVHNPAREQIVERLGFKFQPGETRTVTVRETSLMQLTGAAALNTEIVAEHAPAEPARVDDLSEEYRRSEELEAKLRETQAERGRLADELAAARVAVDEARQRDQDAKMKAVEEGRKPSAVKSTAPKAEAEYEDLAYAHHAAGLRLFELRRDLHRTREPIAAAEHRAAQEREEAARAAVTAAEAELREAWNDEHGKANRPGEHRKKADDADRQRRELVAAGPSGE
ncbi:MAG: hypothetical protein L0G70_01135 [Rubrobacter sp.]|nr:hypothetical protein [Rubrobacter sp.]